MSVGYAMICAIFYHLYNLKKLVILLVKYHSMGVFGIIHINSNVSLKVSYSTALSAVLNAIFDFRLGKPVLPSKQVPFLMPIKQIALSSCLFFVIIASVWIFGVSVPKRRGIIEKKLPEGTCLLWWCNIFSCSWCMYYRINGENAICVSRFFLFFLYELLKAFV